MDKRIPPNSHIEIDMELLDDQIKKSSSLFKTNFQRDQSTSNLSMDNKFPTAGKKNSFPFEEKFKQCLNMKEGGNFLFKESNYEEALEKYEDCIKIINGCCPPSNSAAISRKNPTDIGEILPSVQDYGYTPEEIAKLNEISMSCQMNMTICLLKLERYHEAIKSCDSILVVDSENVKTLFRRAQAYRKIANFERAVQDLNKLKSLIFSTTADDNIDNKKIRDLVGKELKDIEQEQENLGARFFKRPLL